MTRTKADHSESARQCREALGSLHCRLQRRERIVLAALVKFSFEAGWTAALVPSSEDLVVETRLHKSDVSLALSSLTRTRLVLDERAEPMRGFRRPMLYRIMVDDLRRVSQPPPAPSARAQALRADNARWVAHVNECYPLQPQLLPPDRNEYHEALAEISRTSALAADASQNEEPKPGHDAREAYPSEHAARPGSALPTAPPPGAGSDWPGDGPDADQVRHLMAQSMAHAGHPHPAGKPAVVDDSQTTRVQETPDSLQIVNYPRARQIRISDDDRKLSSSGNPDEATPVYESQTSRPPLAVAAAMLLSRYGEEWTPPTRGEEVFAELLGCMGSVVMDNYTPFWLPRCLDPVTRIDVVETIATWKLKRHGRRHKPWRGGAWRDEFHRRQRARLDAERSVAG